MSTILHHDELLSVCYNEKEDLIHSRLLTCDNTEDYMRCIAHYKTVFEKLYPGKVLWDLSEFRVVLNKDLQQWVYNFLDKPASDTGMSFIVGHVVPPDVMAQVAVMEIYSRNEPLSFRPNYFSHINQAMQCMTATPAPAEDVNLQIDRHYKENRAQITLDIPLDLLPDYLREFRKMFENRSFMAEKMQRYHSLGRREKEILSLITKHHSNQEIADRLMLSLETVKTHRKNILRKLNCKHNGELMLYHLFG